LLPQCCEGRGWSRVVGELRNVLAFLVATIGPPSSGDSFLAEKTTGKKARPELGLNQAQIGGKRITGEDGAPSYAEALQSKVCTSMMVRLGDPLGNDRPYAASILLGKDQSDAEEMPTA
jgi:hypothetical protein